MEEYLKAQEKVAEHIKEEWHLRKLGRSLERLFQVGDRIVEVGVCEPGTGQLMFHLYYTPVTSNLRQNGERLGGLLHAMQRFRDDRDPWWQENWEFLEKVQDQLATACSGELLGPPMRIRGTNRVIVRAEMVDERRGDLIGTIGPGFQAVFRIQYLNHLPHVQ
jgi:hypothetical protein